MSTATEPKKNEQKSDLPKGTAKAIADNAKPPESKAEKFRRLANRRVPRTLKLLQHVSNLASTANYEYTKEQALKVTQAIKAKVAQLEHAFSGNKQEENGFSV